MFTIIQIYDFLYIRPQENFLNGFCTIHKWGALVGVIIKEKSDIFARAIGTRK